MVGSGMTTPPEEMKKNRYKLEAYLMLGLPAAVILIGLCAAVVLTTCTT